MNSKILLLILLFIITTHITSAQTGNFKVNAQTFTIKSRKAVNEWNTKDDIREIYIIKKGKQQHVLSYYPYKDEGGDCNNLFWTRESFKIKNNQIIITTHHFQKTGIDPITEWEKKTFTVSKNGEVELTGALYKKYGSNEWKTEEEWYQAK